MANCTSTHNFEGRTITCSRRKGHSGDHQGKIGPGINQLWSENNGPRLARRPSQCASRFRDQVEVFQCDRPSGHPGLHRITFSKEDGGGFMPWTDEEALEPNAVIETTVDGEEAQIVLNGTTGAPIDAEAVPIIEADIRAIEKTLAAVNAELIVAEREKKEAADEFKRVQNRQNAIVAELVRRINGEQPLPFAPSVESSEASVEEDDEDAESAEDVEALC